MAKCTCPVKAWRRAQNMAGQKKQDRRDYLKYFEKSSGGGYVYTGTTWQADPVLRRRMLVRLWALQGIMLISVILPGIVTTAGLLNTFYVIIPYVFWFLSDVVLTYTLGSITFGGNPMRDYIYRRSVAQYTFRNGFPLAGAAMTALAMVAFLLRGGNGKGAVLCFICCAVQITVSVSARRIRITDIWNTFG